MNESELPEVVRDRLKMLDKQRESAISLVPAARVAVAAVAELRERLPADCSLDVAIPMYWDCLDINVHGCSLLDSAEILHVLAKHGYRRNELHIDSPEDGLRIYRVGDIRVCMFPSSEKCNRVQVGEETRPVYEWQCEKPTGVFRSGSRTPEPAGLRASVAAIDGETA